MSTTWADGNVITAAWMNAVGIVAQDGTWATIRNTFTDNNTYDLYTSSTATNIKFEPSITVPSSKQYHFITCRPTVINNGTRFTGYDFDITVNAGAGSNTYGIIGNVTATSGSGTIKSIYGRATANSGFTGSMVGGVSACTVDVGASPASSWIHQMGWTGTVTAGVYMDSDTAGQSIANCFVQGSNAEVTGAVFQWNQRNGGTNAGDLIRMYDGSSSLLWKVGPAGHMTWNGTAQRIYGDFANATHASRTLFQDKTTNNTTSVGVMPNGTGTTAQLLVYGGSDPDNTHRVSLQSGSTANIINSVAKGTGTVKSFAIQMNSSNAVFVDTSKNVAVGVASLATTATDGFPYIPTCAGTPTGVPTTIAGFAPMVFDTTNDKLYIYGGAAWIAIN